MLTAVSAPSIDYSGLASLFALAGGACLALMVGLIGRERTRRAAVPLISILTLATAAGLTIWQWNSHRSIMSGALQIDDLALAIDLILFVAAAVAILMSLGERAVRESGRGEYHALVLAAVTGMAILVAAQNMVTFFIGLELLSIPLYVLCASHVTRRTALESGLKYLIIGSVGSATLLYGLALIYGATSTTDFQGIADAIASQGLLHDPLLLTGMALVGAGLAFKGSIAPFHQWTPDVYEGAPTPITTLMAVATKAAAFAAFLRIFDVALPSLNDFWGPGLAVIATLTMVVGNVGAIGQDSLKRMLGFSGVAQAGYMLTGVVVATQLGAASVVFYLAVYLLMNLGAFAIVQIRERETSLGDSITALKGLGSSRPLLAGVMTICMLSLAGFPATAGFVGKFFLIRAAVDGGYTWLGVAIVVATIVSLVYYLRVVAVMWMGARVIYPSEAAPPAVAQPATAPPAAGGAPEASSWRAQIGNSAVGLPAVAVAAATIFFGIIPQPLLNAAEQAGRALAGIG